MIFDLDHDECIAFVKHYKTIRKFIPAFRLRYDFIIAYHGTNINIKDTELIKSEGLTMASIELLKQRAVDRFVLSSDDPVLKEKINSIIEDQFLKEEFITCGEINFTLDKDPLEDMAYQYLLFGPESLLPVADRLRKSCGNNFRMRMMEYGTPTIVKAKVPVANTSDYWIAGIHGYLNDGGIECCLVYRKDLPREYIIDLESVPRPRDQHGFLWMT